MKRIYIIIALVLTTFISNAQRISVTGNSEIRVTPDLIHFYINASVLEKDYGICLSKSIKTVEMLQENIKNKNINSDILKISRITVNENYEWRNNQNEKNGYRSNISLSIEIPFTNENTNLILEIISDSKTTLNYETSFTLSDSLREKVLQESLISAIKDAKHKAEILASNVNVKIKSIESISDSMNNGIESPIMFPLTKGIQATRQEVSGGFSNISINPEDQIISRSVYIVYKIK